MKTHQVGLVTSHALADLWDDDRLVIAPLAELGIEAVPVVWSDATVAWAELDMVILRSPWDWHTRFREFDEWLAAVALIAHVENEGARDWLDKRYLARLMERSVPVVPVTFIEVGDPQPLEAFVAAGGHHEYVLKPSLSANAHRTTRFLASDAALHESTLASILASGSAAMLQPFVRSVLTEGEWTVVFFEGVFSHALRKVPGLGDFRVQTDHGGHVVPEPSPPPRIIEDAERALEATGKRFLYARVDGVTIEGRLHVMELEVVEPELFLRVHPQGPVRFAKAIAARLRDA